MARIKNLIALGKSEKAAEEQLLLPAQRLQLFPP